MSVAPRYEQPISTLQFKRQRLGWAPVLQKSILRGIRYRRLVRHNNRLGAAELDDKYICGVIVSRRSTASRRQEERKMVHTTSNPLGSDCARELINRAAQRKAIDAGGCVLAPQGVKRLAKLTPDRRPRLTPLALALAVARRRSAEPLRSAARSRRAHPSRSD